MPYTVGDNSPDLSGTVNADLTGADLEAHIKKPDGTVLTKTATAVDATAGTWAATWEVDDLSVVGKHEVELQVTFSGGQVQTFGPQNFYVQQQIA